MKKIILICLLVIGSLTLNTGCKSTPQRIEYNIEQSTVVSVKTAFDAWNSYVKSGKATLDQERQAKRLLSQYRNAALLAHDLTDAYITIASKEPADTSATNDAKTRAGQAAVEASKCLASLTTFLDSLGITVK